MATSLVPCDADELALRTCASVLGRIASGVISQAEALSSSSSGPSQTNSLTGHEIGSDDEAEFKSKRRMVESLSQNDVNVNRTSKRRAGDESEDMEKLIEAGLAVLLESTGLGPDPLLAEAERWSNINGGSIGDWDSCYHLPLEIRDAMVAFQSSVEEFEAERMGCRRNDSGLSSAGISRATRFCTVGGLPRYVKPYSNGGVFWGPPISGICVPSICSGSALMSLFEDADFPGDLLRQASSSDVNLPYIKLSSKDLTGESRRFRYLSALSQSLSVGTTFDEGVACEGESGLRELDSGFRGRGYYATIALLIALKVCVFLGTISSRLLRGQIEKAKVNLNGQKTTKEASECDGDTELKGLSASGSSPLTSSSNSDTNILSASTSCNFNTSDESVNSGFASEGLNASANIQTSIAKYGSTDQYTKGGDFEYFNLSIQRHESGEVSIDIIPSEICVNKEANGERSSKERKPINRWLHGASVSWVIELFSPFDAAATLRNILKSSREANTNTGALINTKPGTSTSISSSRCLDGIRAISMLWIVLGHTLAVQSGVGYTNPNAVLPPAGMIANRLSMLFFSARFAVDTFLFLGGFLAVSGLLKRLDPRELHHFTERNDKDCSQRQRKCALGKWLDRMGITNPLHRVFSIETMCQHSKCNRDEGSNITDRKLCSSLALALFIVRRILRILPAYSFVLLFWWKVAVTLGPDMIGNGYGGGPFWSRWATFVAQCDSNGWTNFLFVNNIIPRRQPLGETSECMYHAWYLGVDLQLSVMLTPLLTAAYLMSCQQTIWEHMPKTRRRWCLVVRTAVLSAELALIIAVVCSSMKESIENDWSGHLLDGRQTMDFDRGFYISSFYRSVPYVIGIMTAQLWHEKCISCPDLGLSKGASIILSLFAISVLLFVTFIGASAYENRPCLLWQNTHEDSCGSGWSTQQLAFYNSFSRPAWSVGLAIMTVLALNGQLSALGSFTVLNWSGWELVSRLSFGMYLLHPLVINIWFLGRTRKFRYSHIDFVITYASVVILTFLAALVVGIFVEWPMKGITKRLETRFLLRDDGLHKFMK